MDEECFVGWGGVGGRVVCHGACVVMKNDFQICAELRAKLDQSVPFVVLKARSKRKWAES